LFSPDIIEENLFMASKPQTTVAKRNNANKNAQDKKKKQLRVVVTNPKPARLANLPAQVRLQQSGAMLDAIWYAHSLIDPGGVELASAPSLVARRGQPMRQVLEGDIASSQIPFGGTNQFYGEVQSDVNNTLLLTTPSSGWESNNTTSYNGSMTLPANANGASMSGGYMFSDNSSNIMVSGRALESGATATRDCFPFVVTTNGNWQITITQNMAIAEPVKYDILSTSDGQNWTTTNLLVLAGSISATSGTFVLPASTAAISFQATCISNGDAEYIQATFRMNNQAASGSQRLTSPKERHSPRAFKCLQHFWATFLPYHSPGRARHLSGL